MTTLLVQPMTLAAPERSASFSAPARPPGLLAVEGGSVYRGRLAGAAREARGELIFTTAASGWGEVLTDPSYAGQIVVLTHPMVGSYRISESELESSRVQVRAVVMNRLVEPPPGAGSSFEELLRDAGIPALTGVDTRALTLELQRGAARRAVVGAASEEDAPDAHRAAEAADAVSAARASERWEDVDHVAAVSPRAAYHLAPQAARRGRAVVLDMGVKRSLLAALTGRGFEVVGLPHDASAGALLAQRPDLVVLSPGPGDPSRMDRQIETVRTLARAALDGGPPILGVCLGHQLLALAAGARTRRLPVGHHGGNHAVMEVETGRVDIGAHNHEVTVLEDDALAAAGYAVTHRDLNDRSVEGLKHASGTIASVQFHPEGAPGPIDASRIFDAATSAAAAAGVG